MGGSLPPPDPGWRYESYRDVVVQVPDSWGYRPTSRCASRPDDRGPFVDTPMDVIDAMACMNHSPLGMEDWGTYVSFSPPEAYDPNPLPVGSVREGEWTRIVKVVGDARIEVLTDDEHLTDARRLVDSARVVTADHNGCAATSPIQQGHFVRPEQAFDDGTTKRALTSQSCQALWGARLTYTSGSGAPFRVCHLEEVFGPAE